MIIPFRGYQWWRRFTRITPTTVFVDGQGNVIGEIIESACSKEEYIDIIKNILDNNTDFKVKDSNISCSIDGKCEIKR